MTTARAHLVDVSVTRWYHCVLRCVRRAYLLGEGTFDRKGWVEERLLELAQIFSVAVAGFAVLDDRLHLLVRLDPDVVKEWSNEEVVRRWARLSPPRDKSRQPVRVSKDWVQSRGKDTENECEKRGFRPGLCSLVSPLTTLAMNSTDRLC